MKKILLVEDDAVLRKGLVLSLADSGYSFSECGSIEEAEQLLQKNHLVFDLYLLDVNLPDGSGIDLCRRLRGITQTPIILLTANDTELDIVAGLGIGADDYITKPFSLSVLRARVAAMLRRTGDSGQLLFRQNGYLFDFERMEVTKDEKRIELSKTELRLLKLFVVNPNQTLTRERLVDVLWSLEAAYVDENALSVTVKRLRDKLEEDSSAPKFIKTIYGVGYRWEVEL